MSRAFGPGGTQVDMILTRHVIGIWYGNLPRLAPSHDFVPSPPPPMASHRFGQSRSVNNVIDEIECVSVFTPP